MSEHRKSRRMDPYTSQASATFEYLTLRREQEESGVVDPRRHYAAIRVRRPDGEMAWIVAAEPVPALEDVGEIMFIAGIDPSSAQFLVDGGAEYIGGQTIAGRREPLPRAKTLGYGMEPREAVQNSGPVHQRRANE
ncbi:hypothetical protein [Mycolicibacterium sp.]|uniref:hypothetical protein n=1 Tax=Mycolicibacterium sp. TaxID=2320850 RepID=UPI0037CA600C